MRVHTFAFNQIEGTSVARAARWDVEFCKYRSSSRSCCSRFSSKGANLLAAGWCESEAECFPYATVPLSSVVWQENTNQGAL